MNKRRIIFGTQYYRPPFPERRAWETDLDLITASGFNTVKLWAVWSWIERAEGAFYFDDLDELMDLCQARGLQTVINIIPEGAPYWLERLHPDARYTSNEGAKLEFSGAANMPSGGWPGLCRDKPEVAAFANRFLTKVGRRYGAHSSVIALDVWNEPHLDPAFDYPDKIFCYCRYSQQRFVSWLKGKYGSLDELNRAWYRAYSSWEDVTAPVRFGTYPDMIDWRLFWLENLAGWLEQRVRAVKEVARDQVAMTHVPFSGYFGGTGKGGLAVTLTDEFLLAEKVDRFGLTSFPKWLMQNDFVQHLMNVELVASAAGAKEFWQSELQSGGGLWGAFGNPVATPDEIRLWNWNSLAGGAKGILYWQWKPEPSGLEAPGFGLTHLDGRASERTDAASEIARRFADEERLRDAIPVPAVNGIYVSRTTALFTFAAGRSDSLYAASLYGAYRAFFQKGIPVRFVHGDRLRDAYDNSLRMLYVPAALALSHNEQSSLINFIKRGGTLVIEAGTGLFDQTGTIQPETSLLEEFGGLRGQIVESHDQIEVQWTATNDFPSKFFGRYYKQFFNSLGPDVQVLAHFETGEPAVCSRTVGEGRIVWIGTFCAAANTEDAGDARPITEWAFGNGYTEIRALKSPPNSLVRLHRTGSGDLGIIAINYDSEPAEIHVAFATASVEKTDMKIVLGARDGRLVWLGQGTDETPDALKFDQN
jgi:beta-galactosidase GanA